MNPKELDDWSKVEELLESPDWCIQLKRDGVRGIIQVTEDGCRVFGRKSGKKDKTTPLEMTKNLPTIASKKMPKYLQGWAFDCEIYHPNKSSAELAGAINPNRVQEPVDWEREIEFWCFDIPIINGKENPYNQEQRSFLMELIFTSYIYSYKVHYNLDPMFKVDTVVKNKAETLAKWLGSGEEGGVLKKLDSPYLFSYSEEGKRSPNTWVKAKKAFDGDFIITGFQAPEKYYTGKKLESWQYWVTDLGHKYYGERRSTTDKPLTKFSYYDYIGAVEYGIYMSEGDFKKYSSKNDNMRKVGKKTKSGKILVAIGTTSGFDEVLRVKMSQEPDKYIGQVVKISGMEQFKDTLAVRHPSIDSIRIDKNDWECEI
jgi:hypothetical protein